MEMKYVTTTCPYCGTGCGLNLITVDGNVVGVAPYHRSPVNRGKLCTRGLHAAKALAEFHLEKPLINGEVAEWTAALAEAEKLKNYKPEEISVAISSRLTNEALFLALKYAKETLHSANIGVINGGTGNSTATLADISGADLILAIGDVMKKLPITGNKFYHAQDCGGKILYIGPESYTSVQADQTVITDTYTELPAEFTEAITAAANPVVVYSASDAAAAALAAGIPAKAAVLYETNNGRGAALMGVPEFALSEQTKALLMVTETPEMENDIYEKILPTLAQLELFVAVGSNATAVSDLANVTLPAAALNEYAGSVTNWEGRVQIVRPAGKPAEGVKTPAEIFTLLSGAAYAGEDNPAIFAELAAAYPAYANVSYEALEKPDGQFTQEVS